MSTWVTGTTVVENSVNAETMTSNVTITLIVGWNGGSWASDSPYYYINVNGSRKKSGNANFNTGQASSGSQTIATWTGDVPHNADGTGSMTWDVGYEGIYAGEGRYSTASGTKTLTTIVVDDSNRFLDKAGLTYFWSKLKNFFVHQETGKGLSTNDFTTAEKTKLSGIESGAEVNVIESIALNGTDQTVTNKAVDLELVTSVNGQTGDVIVEGGEGGGTSNNMVMLWSNPNPTANFSAQTVTLSQSVDEYDILIVETLYGNWGTPCKASSIIFPSAGRQKLMCGQDNTGSGVGMRDITPNGTSVTFGQGHSNNASSESQSAALCIPQVIYGANIRSTAFERAKTLLWTNPSPTATFNAQTVVLLEDSTNFDAFLVDVRYSSSLDIRHTTVVNNDGVKHSVIGTRDASASVTIINWRDVLISGTSAAFTQCIFNNASSGGVDNGQCVPVNIYGIKFGGSNGTPLPTEYTASGSTTTYNSISKSWTVHGSGFVFVSCYVVTDSTNSYGSTWANIEYDGAYVAMNKHRLNSNSAETLAASSSIMIAVTNGKTISCYCGSTEDGTKTAKFRAMAFGCTLT